MKVVRAENEFFIEIGGEKAVLGYKIIGNEMDIYHAFTPESLRGRGLAEKLATAAFEFAKENNLKVVPTCPYVRDYFLPKQKEFGGVVKK